MKDKIGFVILVFLAIIVVITAVDNYNLKNKVSTLEVKLTQTNTELTTLKELGTDERLNETVNGLIKLTNALDQEFKINDEALMMLAGYVDSNTAMIKSLAETHDSNVEIYNKKFREIYKWLNY